VFTICLPVDYSHLPTTLNAIFLFRIESLTVENLRYRKEYLHRHPSEILQVMSWSLLGPQCLLQEDTHLRETR